MELAVACLEFVGYNSASGSRTANSAETLMLHRSDELGEELATVATRGRIDSDPGQSALPGRGRICDEELLRVHRMVQWEVGELQVHTHIDPAGHAQPDCPETVCKDCSNENRSPHVQVVKEEGLFVHCVTQTEGLARAVQLQLSSNRNALPVLQLRAR